jgi:hypothetical protein
MKLRNWPLGFSISPWWVHWQQRSTKFESRIQDPMKHSWNTKSQWKAQEGHLEEGKAARPTKNGKSSQNGKEELRKAQNQNRTSKKSSNSKSSPELTLPNTLNARSPTYIDIYHVSSVNHLISKSSINFVPILSPFGNELIKHKPREERDAKHEIQN